jgi:hypothetical protein
MGGIVAYARTGNSRFPKGMTERNARAKAKARTRAKAEAKANARAKTGVGLD